MEKMEMQGVCALQKTVQQPFSPIIGPKSHTLILGTMASPKSRENGFYYGHPQNRFWPVLAAVFSREMRENGSRFPVDGVPKTQPEREALLLENGLALWDVLAACDITGASDASIRNPVPNDIASLVKRYPIERVFTTGQTAARLYRRLVEPETGLPCTALPSPSPANCRVPFDALVEAYGVLRPEPARDTARI